MNASSMARDVELWNLCSFAMPFARTMGLSFLGVLLEGLDVLVFATRKHN